MSQVNSPTFTEKFVASVYLVMFIVGFTANMLVILVLLLTHGSLKAPAGLYVLHLAVADSLLLISLPFAADNRLRGTWIFGRIACKLMESMKLLNFFSSIFLLTLMGKNRSNFLTASFSCRPVSLSLPPRFLQMETISNEFNLRWSLARVDPDCSSACYVLGHCISGSRRQSECQMHRCISRHHESSQ